MPPVSNEIVYAAMKEAVRCGLFTLGGNLDDYVKNFETLRAILQAALDAA